MDDEVSGRIETFVRRVAARRAAWRTLRQVATAAVVFGIGIALGVWPPAAIASLGLLALGTLILEKPRATAEYMDRHGGHRGLIECAIDHVESSEPVIIAQRGRAWKALSESAPHLYAPAPSAIWWVPIMVVIAISFFVEGERSRNGQSTSDAMAAEATNAAAEQRAKPAAVLSSPKTDVMNRHSRTFVTRNDQQRSQNAADTAEAAQGQAGRKVGSSKGGRPGQKLTPIEHAKDASTIHLKGSRQKGVRGGTIQSTVGEPARPYPETYQEVIESWFKRRKQ